jgi:hypothetical protein
MLQQHYSKIKINENFYDKNVLYANFKNKINEIYFYDGYYVSNGNVFKKIKNNNINNKYKRYEIFKHKYSKGEVVIVENMYFIKSYEIKNIIFSLKFPRLYLLKYLYNKYLLNNSYKIIKNIKFKLNIKSLENLNQINGKNYFLSEKIDGLPCIIAVLKDYGIFIIDMFSEKKIYENKNFHNNKNEIFFGENYKNKIYLFDGIHKNYNKQYEQIILFIKKVNILFPNIINKVNVLFLNKFNKKNKIKFIEKIKNNKMCDGIIIGSINTKKRYKWKNIVTIDFFVKINDKKIEFYVGDYIKNKYMHVLFQTQNLTDDFLAYNNKIIECKYINNKWEIVRERKDKKFANNIKTVISNYNIIKNPIKLNDLLFKF